MALIQVIEKVYKGHREANLLAHIHSIVRMICTMFTVKVPKQDVCFRIDADIHRYAPNSRTTQLVSPTTNWQEG